MVSHWNPPEWTILSQAVQLGLRQLIFLDAVALMKIWMENHHRKPSFFMYFNAKQYETIWFFQWMQVSKWMPCLWWGQGYFMRQEHKRTGTPRLLNISTHWQVKWVRKWLVGWNERKVSSPGGHERMESFGASSDGHERMERWVHHQIRWAWENGESISLREMGPWVCIIFTMRAIGGEQWGESC